MEKSQLSQYMDLKRELIKLEKRLSKLNKIEMQEDKVDASNTEFPYQRMQITIKGMVENKQHERLKNILTRRYDKAGLLKLEIEEFIESIEDSRIRRIFEMRYIDGANWLRISNTLGSRSESYARKIHDRYLNKLY